MDAATSGSGEKAAWTAAAVLLLASLGGAVVLAEWPLWGVQLDDTEQPQLVEPAENGTELWPYTARSTTYDSRTLGMNIVIHGDSEEVRRAMIRRSELQWQETLPEQEDRDPDSIAVNPEAERIEDIVQWGEARGAVRFSYVVVEGNGRWIDESYQLHSGDYLGQRMHLRAYEDPQGEWTAIQAHDEHWDWFRLRHTVTGISGAQRAVEEDFMGAPFVAEVSRLPYGNSTADSDGWVTIVRLSMVLFPLFGMAVATRFQDTLRLAERLFHRHHRELALGVALFSLYLGIRAAGIGLERFSPDIDPRFIAIPLYLILVVGLPAIAYGFGQGSDRAWALTHAVGGLGTAFIIDFVLMGVSVVPLRFALHRFTVVLAIGLIAVGATFVKEDDIRAPLYLGLAGWALALALPLFGYL